ncbi:MAG: methionine--tRNA ligase [Desulfovibrionaceae bacterium]|nr:methionine--tRNA ligase [Desulfovibrionaceae bacterium]MBF0514507.1 methionine--tRNA ligase [Desulfovibrionaceae bacterium]
MKRQYITTPIYYVNARPHLGHAYTTIVADALNRFAALTGKQTFFLTGTDEHGDKIVKAAQAAGQTPGEYCDAISAAYQSLWPKLGVAPSAFIRTTDPAHALTVKAALQKVHDAGDIYFGEYGGHYCFGCERFYTEKELQGGVCPDHQTKPEYIAEKNYFFKMSKYQDRLARHIRENPDFIRPAQYRSEVLSILDSGVLEDLCISRPKSRLTWGIELPFDAGYVTYVWFDALLNYVSALGWPDGKNFADFWPSAQHLVAKDILKPHAIFWPTMLMALGLPLYNHLNVHGYWLSRDTKMSKSVGNVVDPEAMAEKYGLAGLRYFLLREMTFGSDASFSEQSLTARFNADLANDLGNLLSRTLTMVHKYCGGAVPAAGEPEAEERAIIELASDALENFHALFGALQFSRALESLWELIRALNKYIDAQAPWTLFKEGRTAKLGLALYTVLEAARKAVVHLVPVMPEAAGAMLVQLGFGPLPKDYDLTDEIGSWGFLPAGASVAASSNQFPRIDATPGAMPEKPAKTAKPCPAAPAPAPCPAPSPAAAQTPAQPATETEGCPEIEFADFQRLDLRVGTVVAAAKVAGADKLLEVLIDIGEGSPRTVVAGIAEFHDPDALVGRQVAMLANLKPRKLRGVVSRGMILAVRREGGLELLSPANPVPSGAKIS